MASQAIGPAVPAYCTRALDTAMTSRGDITINPNGGEDDWWPPAACPAQPRVLEESFGLTIRSGFAGPKPTTSRQTSADPIGYSGARQIQRTTGFPRPVYRSPGVQDLA